MFKVYCWSFTIVLLCFVNNAYTKNCPPNHFILKGMPSCHRMLNCEDINKLLIVNKLTDEGNVKEMYLTKWGNFSVVFVKPKNIDFIADFNSGLNLLKLLNGNKFITNLIGFCDETNYYVIEFYELGDARNILKLLANNDTIIKRMELCINYVEILHYLHSGNPFGRFVFCDSNDLMKLLSQLLINDDRRLILSDLDALPIVKNNEKIVCGQRKLSGDFVAPEQRQFNGKYSPIEGYNEKSDIWKVPDVCNYFLKNHEQYNLVIYYLFDIHKRCKNINPDKRPSALQIIVEYKYILKQLSTHDDL